MKKHRWSVLLPLTLASCGGGDAPTAAPPPPPVPTTVSVSPAQATMEAIEETVQFTAQVADQNGNALTGTSVSWTSSAPGVVAVDPATGLAEASGAGTAVVTARAGSASGTATATVRQVARAIERAGGDEQRGVAGEALPVSPSVLVKDANGHPAGQVTVAFEVASGGGSVSPGATLTGADGLARTTWTLGADSVQALSASAGGLSTTFQATAGPPLLAVATDSLKQGRLTVSYAETLVATGGSLEGYAWSLAEGSDLPPGLLLRSDGGIVGVPTEAGVSEFEVQVADSEGGQASQVLSMRVCDGPLGLETGDVQVMTGPETEPCGFFVRAPEAGAYYRVVIAGASPGMSRILPVELAVEAVSAGQEDPRSAEGRRRARPPVPVSEWQDFLEIELANDALHRNIRRQEAEMFRQLAAEDRLREVLDRGPAAQRSSAYLTQNQSSPEQRTFRFSQIAQPDGWDWSRCEVDRTVAAKLLAENEYLAVYEDATSTAPVSLDNVNRVLDYYADHGAEVIEGYFGGVSDVNGDGRVAVVVDPLLDGVRAYVWSNDMLVSQADCAASNEMELVHISAGAFNQFDDNRYWALSGMVHELKHVSSTYTRVRNWYRRGGNPSDAFWHPTWIEEGTAEIAKEMSSRLAWERVGGPSADARITGEMARAGAAEAWAEFYGVFGVLARTVRAFRVDPNAVTFEPEGEGHVYGSGWHFHRFLRDWFADAGSSSVDDEAFVRALNDSITPPGAPGISSVVGETLPEILTAHAVAMTVAGAESSLTNDETPRFTSFDFPSATDIFSRPNPPGTYPWPVTTTGEDDDSAVMAAPLAQSATFRGRVGESGVRVHDFRAQAAGAAAVFRVDLPSRTRVVIARIPDPAP